MSVSNALMRAIQEARQEQEREKRDQAEQSRSAQTFNAALDALNERLNATKVDLLTERSRREEVERMLASRDEALSQKEVQIAFHVERARAVGESEAQARAAFQTEREANRAAQERAQQERELRIVAENRPPEVKIIREPAPTPALASPPPTSPEAAAAPVLPEPPHSWKLHVRARDPNNAISLIELVPGD